MQMAITYTSGCYFIIIKFYLKGECYDPKIYYMYISVRTIRKLFIR